MKKNFIFLIILMIIIAGAAYFVWQKQKGSNQSQNNNPASGVEVKSFEECAASGNPVMESYPQPANGEARPAGRQCSTPDGKHFTENIGNMLEKIDLVQINQPKPNQLVTNPTTVIGQARGSWFFEGQMPLVIVDADGMELGKGTATAFSDWTKENFVPFEATLSYNLPSTDTGTIIIKKDNPSGLPENDDQLEIPIRFRPVTTNPAK